ncbi:MAG: DinB family protein [Chloroflexota bacterium]
MEAIVATLLERCQWVHQVLRDEVRGLTPEQLDFAPAAGANSVGVLVAHIVGAQTEIWSMVANAPFERDRPAEFASRGVTAEQLLARLDAMDRLLVEVAPRIDAAALATVWRRPNGEAQTGLYWLVNHAMHVREHMGHIQLTKQLRPDQFPPPTRAY